MFGIIGSIVAVLTAWLRWPLIRNNIQKDLNAVVGALMRCFTEPHRQAHETLVNYTALLGLSTAGFIATGCVAQKGWKPSIISSLAVCVELCHWFSS